MFGMENKSKTTIQFLFDLEKDLTKEDYRIELAKRLEVRIRRIRELLHSGAKKEQFEQLGSLLNGYHALAIVLGRATQESKKQKG